MLKEMKLDLVEIHMKLPKSYWNLLVGLLKDTGQMHNVKVKAVNKAPLHGHYLGLVLDGQRLEIGIYRQYATRWIMYRFKGRIDVATIELELVLLGEASLAYALVNGTVKTLELAMDIPGHHTRDYLFHLRGAHSSHVAVNAENNGFTYYMGSRHSQTQVVAYDKAQEIRDKGGTPQFKDILRIEARVRNFQGSMLALYMKFSDWDPFERVIVVEKSAAIHHKTSLNSWGLFISACELVGTPTALGQFKWQKKSLLTHVVALQRKSMTPTIQQFKGALEAILPSAELKKTIGQINFQALYEATKPKKKSPSMLAM